MPYEVTATRKRPQIFEQLAGQEFVAATLEKSLETGRIAHAYLFSGPRGCGKTSTARILAKALNCEKGPGPHPCGVCDSCRAIAAGSSLDVIEIDGASNTSVENVRQIKDEVLFPPNSSRYKIYIIDEVHMLSTSAFNALLKTIEEPPPYVVFMFATTEQHKVPATIKSRCQQFTFRLVSSDIIKGLLAEAAGELGVKAEDEALLWIARESGGSVRDAYTLFDQVVSFAEGNITASLIREKLGLVGQDRMNALFGFFIEGETAGALSALDAILSSGVSAEQFIADTVEYCRALLMLKQGISRESILGAPLSSFDQGIIEALSGERIERILSIFLSAYRNLKESIDARYELDLAVAKASHINDYVAPSDMAKAVSSLKRYLEKNAASITKLDVQGSAPARPPAAQNQARHTAAPATPPAAEPARHTASSLVEQPARPESPNAQESAGPETRAKSGPAEPKAANPEAVSPETAGPGAPVPGLLPASIASANLSELKKNLVSDIRKNNVLLATTLEKSRKWQLRGDILVFPVNTRMEFDLLRRFLGIIAEVLAQRLGFPQKIDVVLAENEDDLLEPFHDDGQSSGKPGGDVGAGADAGGGGRIGPRMDAGARADAGPGAGPGPGAQDYSGQLSRTANSRPESNGYSAFNDRGKTDTYRQPNSIPPLSLRERETISLVERFFKGSLSGFAHGASAPAGQALSSPSETFAESTGAESGGAESPAAEQGGVDPMEAYDNES